MTHRRRLAALLTPLLLALTLLPGTATAETEGARDPAGDGSWGSRLDITRVTVRNQERRIVVRARFRRVANGSLYAALDARRRPGQLAIVAERRRGQDRTFLLGREGDRQPCRGDRARWDAAADTVRIVLPAYCFRDGDYRAVRTRGVSERGGGAQDVDLYYGGFRWSEWAARG